jgi:hypothetical protein
MGENSRISYYMSTGVFVDFEAIPKLSTRDYGSAQVAGIN